MNGWMGGWMGGWMDGFLDLESFAIMYYGMVKLLLIMHVGGGKSLGKPIRALRDAPNMMGEDENIPWH